MERGKEGRGEKKDDKDKGEEKRWKGEGVRKRKEERRKKKRGNEREEEEHDYSLPWHPTITIVGCILSSSDQLVQEAAY